MYVRIELTRPIGSFAVNGASVYVPYFNLESNKKPICILFTVVILSSILEFSNSRIFIELYPSWDSNPHILSDTCSLGRRVYQIPPNGHKVNSQINFSIIKSYQKLFIKSKLRLKRRGRILDFEFPYGVL